MTTASYPKNPTTGWMRSELERRGVDNRGHPFTDRQLVKMLADVGVIVGEAEDKRKDDDR